MAYPEKLTSRFDDALQFAARRHQSQVRKGTQIPYVAHLLSVAALVLEDGGDEDEAIAALLHDAVEDQGGAAIRAEIGGRFGERVAAIVDGCTDADVIPKPPWRARKEAYLAHIRHAPLPIRRVSLADKVHNARAILFDYRQIGDELWLRFNGGRDGTVWNYRALANAFAATTPGPLAQELVRLVDEIEHLSSGTAALGGLPSGYNRE
jgi:(p)ppGpp synthase/HD superfamily hydrolase